MGDHSQSENSGSRKNLIEAEDLLNCSTCSNTTNDAIVGIDQHGDAFWKKSHTYWLAHKKDDYLDRHSNSLMQRFSRIRTTVNKFCGYLAQVELLSEYNQRFSRIRTAQNKFCGYLAQVELLSEYNEDDKIARVKKMYFQFETKSNVGKKNAPKAPLFAFEH